MRREAANLDARELAERRAASWKLLAKRYRADAAEWKAAFEAAAAMHAGALAASFTGRVIEPAPRCPECGKPARDAEGSKRAPFCSWKRKRSASDGARVPADLYDTEGSAQASSTVSRFPGAWCSGMQGDKKMSKNGMVSGVSAGGAEGRTLNTGEPTQPNQAAPGRFPKTACHKLANGVSASAGAEDGRGGSSVQCERNGTDVQAGALDAAALRWLNRSGQHEAAEVARLREDVERLAGHAAGGRPELVPFAQALDAARSWARDWLDVYGQPSALWELLLRFAALVAMRPGEKRRLDEAHTVRLFEAEPGALLEVGQLTAGIVLPFSAERFGRALPEREVAELEATVRGAIQRVEALQAEAELFRHAATLIRGDGFSDHWTAGADFRDMAGVPLDGPHPDAYRFSLVGAMHQAWAERGGLGPVPRASLKRLVTLAAPACFTFKVESATVEALQDVLRLVNDHRDPGGMMRGQTAKSVLELLTRAALAADAEAESAVL